MSAITRFDDLLPYQQDGVAYLLSRRRAYLADDMGVGKTAQASVALREWMDRRPDMQPPLVICPAIAKGTWAREYRQWTDGKVAPRVESYEYVRRHPTTFAYWGGPVVLDEAHQCSNGGAMQTRVILGRDGVVCTAPVVWCLSGTPIRNSPLDLWPVLYQLFPDVLRAAKLTSRSVYLDTFCHWRFDQRYKRVQVFGMKNGDRFAALCRQIWLRRTAAEVLPQLPPITWGEATVEITAAERAELDRTVSLASGPVVRAVEDGTDFPAGVSVLRSALAGVKARHAGDAIADELDAGLDKVFVTAYHHAALDVLEDRLNPYGVVRIDGATSPTAREHAMARFRSDVSARVFLGQLEATNTAVTLHSAARVHMVEPSWVPSDNVQSAKRVHRLGQTRPVVVTMWTVADTIDEQVNAVLRRKARMLTTMET